MKKLLFSLFLLLTATAALWAQAPQRMSYQSIIRDGSNVLVASTPVGIKISVVRGTATGTAVYIETHRKTTNANGLVSLEIGEGTALTGRFSEIDWSNGPYLIKTETDPTGGTNYSIPGIAPLNSVPYALYAANGTPGPKGDKGDTGATGETGPTGATGPQGERGLTGATGPAGATGAQGPIGLTGLQGAVGQTGPVGPQGVAGPAGATGPQGPAGPTGAAGPIGLTGPAGATGPAGIDGAAGATGAQGVAGPQGPAGPTGAAGPIGLTGPAGATGPAGIDGAAGATGAQGVAGPQGPAGPTGAAGLLTSGSAAGNTPYWDGTQWVVNSSNLFNNGSNIGIGTTSPSSKLQVVGSGSSGDRNNMLRIESNNNASLTLKNTNANAGGGEYQLFTSSSNSNPALGAGSLAIYYDHPTNAAYRLSINTAGNVGIGTGMPTEKLDVAGNLKTSGTVTTGTVIYPNAHGASGQVLTTTGTGALSWTTPPTGLPTSGNTVGDMLYWNGTVWVRVAASQYNDAYLQSKGGVPTWTILGRVPTQAVDVTNPTTGKIWMDRNLGATQVATSSTDAASYGDLYQWGRGADGHQIRTSGTTPTLSSTDTPVNGNFILASSSPSDWRSPQNTNLWQAVNGVNNPCPTGYRIPTDAELDAERSSWITQNTAGAFASPLKLPMAGGRYGHNGSLFGSEGDYWSSTVSGTNSRYLSFDSSSAGVYSTFRSLGLSVRCLKD